MNTKTAIYICIHFAILNVAYSQSLNRIISNCGLNGLPITENVLPNLGNQLNYLPYDLPYEIVSNVFPGAIQPNAFPLPNVIQRLPNVVQPLPNVIQPLPNVLQQGLPNLLQQSVVAPAIIQDNAVANNLANALQLVVVSNLLRNTLPQARDVVPAYPPVEFVSSAPLGGGFNYYY